MRTSRLDGLPGATCAALAVAVAIPYVWGALGGAIWPALTAVAAGAAFLWFWPRTNARQEGHASATGHLSDGLLFLATTAAMTALLFATAWPHALPPGGGADVTHHLMLVEELARTRHLVTEPAAGLRLAEMAHYTPGLHLFTVDVAALAGAAPWRLLYPVVLVTVALKAGLLVLMARRVVGGTGGGAGSAALAATAVALVCFVPRAYSVGGFLEAGFLAQVASEATMVAGWWALLCWHQSPSRAWAALVGLASAATFVVWPIYLGPLALASAVVLWRGAPRVRGAWWPHLVWTATPPAIVAALHLWWHAEWLRMAGANGAVPAFRPDLALAVLVVLAAGGALARRDVPAMRVVLLVGAAIVLQALALWALAASRGAGSPYMAAKMIYLAAYPLAVLGAAGLARVVGRLPRTRHAAAAVAALLATMVVAERLVARVAVPPPLASIDLHDAGAWLRERASPECVEYVVPNRDVAYWLHLAVMGNPRVADRTSALDTYTANAAVGRWVEGTSLPFAIADRRLVPSGLARDVTTIRTVGDAVVLSRPLRPYDPDCSPPFDASPAAERSAQ